MPLDNPVRRLKSTSPAMEIWWDSSPLVYADWLEGPGWPFAPARLFQVDASNPERPRFSAASLLDGATTNQPLTWQVLEKHESEWATWVAAQPAADRHEALWRLFIEVAARGAAMLEPIFEYSGGARGQICCQVDPRNVTDLNAMMEQARRIHAARPNIMVKLPGSREGIEAVRLCAAEGIPTNVTLGFTVSQLLASGEAARAGHEEALRRRRSPAGSLPEGSGDGTDLSHWRSCATMMLGRYEDAPPLREQARALGIELSEAEVRWAGIAIFRKAHTLFRERGYPTKLMAASMRVGPTVEDAGAQTRRVEDPRQGEDAGPSARRDGRPRVWHLEKLAGAGAVLTVFPNILEAFLAAYEGETLRPVVDEPVPPEVLERLLTIPYFAEAYDEEGLAPEEFADHPAFRLTAASFVESMERIEAFAARHGAPGRDQE